MRVVIEFRDRRGQQQGEADVRCEPHGRELLQRVAPTARWPEPWEPAATTTLANGRSVVVRVLKACAEPCDICLASNNPMLTMPPALVEA